MTPSSRRNLGLGLILTPPLLVMASIVLFGVLNFVFSLMGNLAAIGSSGGGWMVAANVTNIILGFMGLLGILGMFTAFPVGLYLFFSTPKTPSAPPQA